MAADTFTISCPACRYQLTLATSYAGMTGPCPMCRTLFQVPYPSGHHARSSYAAHYPQPPQQPNYYPPPQVNSGAYYMTPQGPYYVPNPYYRQPSPYPSNYPPPYPVSAPALPAPTVAAPPAERQLWQNRSSIHGTPAPILTPDVILHAHRDSDSAAPQRRVRRKNPDNFRMLALLFVVAAVGIFLGVGYVLRRSGEPAQPADSAVAAKKPAAAMARSIAGSNTKFIPPDPLEPPPSLPDGMPAVAQGKAAIEVLEKFLAAKTLEERLPFIETQTPETELANSVLAGPLPAVTYIELDTKDANPIEQLMDYYHNVDLQLEGNQVSKQTLLVRTRGQSPPKVVVDPFLDSFGGRLAAYAKAPTDKAGIFQVIISPIASCNDERIPFPEKKRTLKLLPRDGSKEITRAYFAKQSKIAQMLDDGTYSFNYGSAKACTVMLRWNTEDDSDLPYLEAIDLKALNWNP